MKFLSAKIFRLKTLHGQYHFILKLTFLKIIFQFFGWKKLNDRKSLSHTKGKSRNFNSN